VKRKLAVVTGTRAEYGLLYPLMKEIEGDPGLQLQLVVTGMHLSPEYGLTYREIEADGFAIDEKVEMLVSSDTPAGVTTSMGLGMIGMAQAFARLQPDIAVLLGDRYETLGAAIAASIANIPVAHIHGGERTEGTMDEAFRHAITKLAHIHFVAAGEYCERVVQLGEQPSRIFNFGSMAVDQIRRTRLLSRSELEEALSFRLGSPLFLVTFHPVTWTDQGPEEQISGLLQALERFPEASILITKPNSDPGGRAIASQLEDFVERYTGNVKVVASLGRQRYLSALQIADIVIGNSSSGIIEAPLFRKATVNIGERQKGRMRGESVIDCDNEADAIAAAIGRGLSPSFRETLQAVKSLYGEGNAASRIAQTLKTIKLDHIVTKVFHDLKKGE